MCVDNDDDRGGSSDSDIAVFAAELLQVQPSHAVFTSDQHTSVNSPDKRKKKKRKHELSRWLHALVLWCQ